MGIYDVEGSKITAKLKKSYLVNADKKTEKLKKCYVVGADKKLVKLWSGSPQAFLITTSNGVMFSTDLVTWETLDFLDMAHSSNVNVAYGNGTYVIAYSYYNSEGGWIASSLDGKTWTMQKLQDFNTSIVLGFCNGKFVCSVCYQSSKNQGYTYTSADGFNWTYLGIVTFPGNIWNNCYKRRPVYGNFNGSPYYVIGTGNYAWGYSSDLKTWTGFDDSTNSDAIADFFSLKDNTIYTLTGNYSAPKLRNLSVDGHPVVVSTANPSTYGSTIMSACYNTDTDELAILTGTYTTVDQLARYLHVTSNRTNIAYKGRLFGYNIPNNHSMIYGNGTYVVVSINYNSPNSVSVFYSSNGGVSWTEKVLGTDTSIDSYSKIFFGY